MSAPSPIRVVTYRRHPAARDEYLIVDSRCDDGQLAVCHDRDVAETIAQALNRSGVDR